MMCRWIAGTAVVVLALMVGGRLLGEEKKARAEGKRFDLCNYIGDKLGLDEKQKEEIRKIRKDFEAKTDPLIDQLWTLHHEECEAMKKALTDEQCARLPAVLRAEKNKEFQKITSRLELNDEQKATLEKVREMYHKKFEELAQEKGENKAKEFRELRHEAFNAACQALKPDQCARLLGVMREEFRLWRDPEVRRQHLKAIADQLGLSEQQREQEQKILDEYNRKIEQPASELKHLFRDEHEHMEKVLTPEQRVKWMELKKNWGLRAEATNRKEEK